MPEPTHVYLDLDVVNNDYTAAVAPQLRFEEVRNTPFLEGDSSEYFCSVVRFSVQTANTLPVFIPRIQTGQDNPLATIYRIVLCDYQPGDVTPSMTGEQFVSFEPDDLTVPVPAPPLVKQDMSSTYYHIYNYQHFIRMVNYALSQASRKLRQTYSGNGPYYFTPNIGIYLDWDTSTNRAVLNVDKAFVDNKPDLEIYCFRAAVRIVCWVPCIQYNA